MRWMTRQVKMEKDSNTFNGDNLLHLKTGERLELQDPEDFFQENAKNTLNREGVEQRVVMVGLML